MQLILIFLLLVTTNEIIGDPENYLYSQDNKKINIKQQERDSYEYDNIISEFKIYLNTLEKKTIDEIINYYITINKIKKEQYELYIALDDEAKSLQAKRNAIKNNIIYKQNNYQLEKQIDNLTDYIQNLKPEIPKKLKKYEQTILHKRKEKKTAWSKLSEESKEFFSKKNKVINRIPINLIISFNKDIMSYLQEQNEYEK